MDFIQTTAADAEPQILISPFEQGSTRDGVWKRMTEASDDVFSLLVLLSNSPYHCMNITGPDFCSLSSSLPPPPPAGSVVGPRHHPLSDRSVQDDNNRSLSEYTQLQSQQPLCTATM
ncbi:unnamed protein product [Mortierella alpina]